MSRIPVTTNASRTSFDVEPELLGHVDLKTTMIYTHVLNKPGLAVRSPVDLI